MRIPLGATPKVGAASIFVMSERRAGNGRKLLVTATAEVADIRKDDHRQADGRAIEGRSVRQRWKPMPLPLSRDVRRDRSLRAREPRKGTHRSSLWWASRWGHDEAARLGRNPRGNRTKSQDLARNPIRPGKSAMLQGMVVCPREVRAGGNTSPHTFLAAAAPIPCADRCPGRSCAQAVRYRRQPMATARTLRIARASFCIRKAAIPICS